MAKLSTHILDTANGKPAAGVKINLYRRDLDCLQLIKSLITNDDGRTDELLLNASEIQAGEYEIEFLIGDYFLNLQQAPSKLPFLSTVPVRFSIADEYADYHVPLLVSPWSYSTYRGS